MENDIVYTTRPGNNNRELRMSLRSLKNLPHRNVVIVGQDHDWATNVIKIKNPRTHTAWEHSLSNYELACNDERVSDNFYLFNDDFFILTGLQEMPVHHRGPVKRIIERYDKAKYDTRYIQGMRDTVRLLKKFGISDPISYELHVPLLVNKEKFKQALVLSKQIEGFGKRTIYGNLNNIGGTQIQDVKVTLKRRGRAELSPYISTDDDSFIILGIYKKLQKQFPERSKYELY